MNIRTHWLTLFMLFNFVEVGYAVEYSICYKNLTDSDKAIAEITKAKIIKSEHPNLPTSLNLASLMQNKEPPFDIGCVTLKFEITKNGSVKNIKIAESLPANIFDRSAIQALKNFIFMKQPGIGIQVFNYQITE